MPPKTIFVDFNGTISHSLFWGHIEGSEEKGAYFKLWNDALFVDRKEEINKWMRGGYTTEEIVKYVTKITESDYDFALNEFIIGCQKMTFASPGIEGAINKLKKRGVKMVIATNNMDCFTRWTAPAMGLDTLFDQIINSFDRKALKHDLDQDGESLFFGDYFKKKVLDPKDCIFIDDSTDRMDAISNLGIRYIQIKHKEGLEEELTNLLKLL